MGSQQLNNNNNTQPPPPLRHFSLSSLSSQINKWGSTSRSTSPVKKRLLSPSPPSSSSMSKKRKKKQVELQCQDSTTVEKEEDEADDYIPWYKKYEPASLDEVVVHKQKLKDVKDVFESMLHSHISNDDADGYPRILLLTGPSGSSKSTLIKQLAKELIPKYRNTNGLNSSGTISLMGKTRKPMEDVETNDIIEYSNDLLLNGMKTMDAFREFLNQCKYKCGNNLSVILIEDLPNVFHAETRYIFQKSLLEWLYSSDIKLPPLVICLTECEIERDNSYSSFTTSSFNIDSTFTAETVLGREILSHPRLKRIKFNSINRTLMKSHLMKLCEVNKELLIKNDKWKDRIRFIKDLISSNSTTGTGGNGDIRSGIASLEMWARSKSKTDDTSLLIDSTRESSISYFHGIGRIIYGSKDYKDDNEMINDLILNMKGMVGNDTFKLGLLENYGTFNKNKFDIKLASEIINSLSEGDTMNDVELFEYTLRKIRFEFHKMKKNDDSSYHHGKANFPREWKIRRLMNEFKIESEDFINVSLYKYNEVHQMNDIIYQYGYYGPFIRRIRNYKKKVLMHCLKNNGSSEMIKNMMDTLSVDDNIDLLRRIGGDIKVIDTEHYLISEDDTESQTRKSLDYLLRQRDYKLQKLIHMKEHNELKASHDGVDTRDDDTDRIDEKEKEEEEELLLNDRIEDSDSDETDIEVDFHRSNNAADDDADDDDDDESFYEMLSQKAPRTNHTSNIQHINDESLSDSDIENL
ncbi:Rad24p NDAI_0B02290 [Naumovozyma dairenensis CBS 421]|uniref:AAA+ ATPase domain-containing protein n=1 Tax=Naumovozyma dairenensis (strain ATCC 10597 / BCRC 20456 / CBS 421 / NBRC 0211 / NRRL Y-12639) TaxID=1071378 RepID=G0W653_NAUDC|nr:hypothetical protein NDAI_0B02290 [Naumovozyma dairenensis CBS 421]CCD23264.1 hypothetical protein NDAI_0B02290 [Naumovozyma dairenensis CBS 421]